MKIQVEGLLVNSHCIYVTISDLFISDDSSSESSATPPQSDGETEPEDNEDEVDISMNSANKTLGSKYQSVC